MKIIITLTMEDRGYDPLEVDGDIRTVINVQMKNFIVKQLKFRHLHMVQDPEALTVEVVE